MTFHIGQKIVCIDDDWWGGPKDLPLTARLYIYGLPVKHSVYHVRDVVEHNDGLGLYLRLVEIVNPEPPLPLREVAFDIECFRPVTDRKTDISIFTSMLQPKETETV